MTQDENPRRVAMPLQVRWMDGADPRERALSEALDEIQAAALAALERNRAALDAAGFVHLPALVELDVFRIKTAALHRWAGGDR